MKVNNMLTCIVCSWLTVTEYLCQDDNGYVPFAVITITGFVTKVTRRVPHMEQEFLTFLEHPCSHPVFSGIRVAQSLVFCAVSCR